MPVNDQMKFQPARRNLRGLSKDEVADFAATEIPQPTYSIRGQIKSPIGQLHITVEVRPAAGKKRATVTGADGNFSFSGLPPGDYVVTPIDDRMNFEPGSHSIKNLARDVRADFLGTPRQRKSPGTPIGN